MTRKKDKITQKKDLIRKTKNLHKSRIYKKQEEINKNQEEISQEIKLLIKISNLSIDLIRIIYEYMSGNGKLFCNYKYDYIEKKLYLSSIDIIEKLSKKELFDLINKGILRKYPNEIIEYIDCFRYSLELDDFETVNGYHLFDLWQANRLDYNFDENSYIAYEDNEDKDLKRLNQIKFDIKHEIYSYLSYILSSYRRNKKQVLSKKNFILIGNTLFLKLDKAFYLFKCIEYMYYLKNKNI